MSENISEEETFYSVEVSLPPNSSNLSPKEDMIQNASYKNEEMIMNRLDTATSSYAKEPDKSVASVSTPQAFLQEKTYKNNETNGLQRRKSLSHIRRLFQKHARSYSASPTTRREDDNFDNQKSVTQLQKHSIITTSAAGEENIVKGCESMKNATLEDSVNSDRITPITISKRKLRHINTLPTLLARPTTTREEGVENVSPGTRLWRKLGTINFSRRELSTPSPDQPQEARVLEAQVDEVYQVLKEGIVLRECKDSGCNESFHRSYSSDSISASQDKVQNCGFCSSLLVRKKTLHHQMSDPTCDGTNFNRESPQARSCGNSKSRFFSESNVDHPEGQPHSTSWLSKVKRDALKDNENITMKQMQHDKLEKFAVEGCLYVALFKYEAQEEGDISLRYGEHVRVVDDRHETWWKGECNSQLGFFPANFVMKLQPNEQIHTCIQLTSLKDMSNKEIVQLKKNQIVAVKYEWPVKDQSFVYARCSTSQGYVRKEDVKLI